MNNPSARPAAPAPAPCVMLLSLWPAANAEWHARLVDTDAGVRDFDSPFELARYLAAVGRPPQAAPGGLR